ncbi:MAG: efflux RND transporter permease subunit [Ignavibacteriae bacterium]|nr:efflux RND transporter permease subunit [Ignavibacteriota bacterium]MCB9214483.1 efflux RND transporter permease subunit [Ignavibacteria bacterium]
MSLSSLSIRRPVLATVLSLVIILFGVIGFTRLGVREYPSVDPPVITVSTSYPGANADIIESQITEPIEESVNGIAGIRTITSVSRESRSTITIEFTLDIDLETAANDVRDRVSRAQRSLPPDVDNPIVSKSDADAGPIIFLNVSSDSRDPLELTEIGINLFKERVQTIPGVSSVAIWGEKRYSMRIALDPARLTALGLSLTDVAAALNRENVELPTGRIEGEATELSVRTVGRLTTPEEFNNLIIAENNGSIIRLRDVGSAAYGPENERTVLKRDGKPMIGVVLIPQPGANNIAIANEFYKRLEEIKKDLPADIQLGIGFDTTNYIRDSIDEVVQTIFVAFGLVVLVIFLFLRDFRTTIIPTVVIPVSLVGTFAIMLAAGFSINVLTLLGIVLAIGLVVDDAIVVLENIYTKIEQGMSPLQAGFQGSKEIFFAVIATTVALAAVFMPVMFLEGLTGRLFREFGVVLAGAVIISSFVALTLTPMLATRLLKQGKHNRFYEWTEPFFRSLTDIYGSILESFMRQRWLVFPIILLCGFLIWFLMSILPSELAPLEDRSGLRMFATAPEGATFEYMDNYMDQMITLVKDSVPEISAIISVTSPGFGASSSVNSGFMRIILTQPDERGRTQSQIAGQLNGLSRNIPGARVFFSEEQTIGGRRGGLPVQFVIQAPNFERLTEKLPQFLDKTGESEVFNIVDIDLKFNKPELQVSVDREKARVLGISMLDVAQALQVALSDGRMGYFTMNGKQYQVIGQLEKENRNDPIDLNSIFLRNNRGEMIQLDNLIETKEESRPPQLYRFNRYVSATVSAGLADGYSLGNGIEEMERIAEEVLDDSFSTSLTGTSRDFVESSSSLFFAFGLALLLIYLALAAQFESFRDPFIILFTVPLALSGALLSLWYFDQTLNIFSQIGMIMLIGLVTKNGILIVEFANQRREAGLGIAEAILDASAARFRPILMTSLSTILGALPIALALGSGAQSRVSMGIVLVGGLIIATLLTLFVVPGVYSLFTSKGLRTIPLEELEVIEGEQ